MSSDEWTLMYRNGLTAKMIAELCDVPVDGVVRALAWSKRRDPSLAGIHAERLPRRPPVISVKWCERYQELVDFISSNGRMPYTHVSDDREA